MLFIGYHIAILLVRIRIFLFRFKNPREILPQEVCMRNYYLHQNQCSKISVLKSVFWNQCFWWEINCLICLILLLNYFIICSPFPAFYFEWILSDAVFKNAIFFFLLIWYYFILSSLFHQYSVIATMIFPSHTMWHICVLGAIYVWFYHIIQYQKMLGAFGCEPYNLM